MRYLRSLLLMLGFVCIPVYASADGLSVYFSDREDVPLDTVEAVPLFVDNVPGGGFLAVEVHITYDNDVIRPVEVFTQGTLTSGWVSLYNIISSAEFDTLIIGMFSALDAVTNPGTLLFIEVEPAESAAAGDSTVMHIENFWYDGVLAPNTQDGTAYIVGSPDLVVNLASFEAYAASNAVILEWVTGTELDNLGFSLYRRSDGETGEPKRINDALIYAMGDVTAGWEYLYSDEDVVPGVTYYYELEDVALDGTSTRYGPIVVTVPVPAMYALRVYPNPFNPETTIRYDVPNAGRVRLSIYALNGQHVRTLADAEYPAASYSVTWDGTDDNAREAASGVYVCKMIAGENSAVRKMLLLR